MATALKLYTKDQNLNAISKTVSNVNPVATDYVLKNFSEQLVNLSANNLQKVERVDTKDITNASTDTTSIGLGLSSSTDFFSTDDTTWRAYAQQLAVPVGDTSKIEFYLTDNDTMDAGYDYPVTYLRLDSSDRNVTQFVRFINARLIDNNDEHSFKWAVTGDKATRFTTTNSNIKVQLRAVSDTKAAEVLAAIWEGMSDDDKHTADGVWSKSEASGYYNINGRYSPV